MDMEKLHDACSGNGSMCIIVLQCIRLDLVQFFLLLPYYIVVQRGAFFKEGPFPFKQRCCNCRSNSGTLRMVVYPECSSV